MAAARIASASAWLSGRRASVATSPPGPLAALATSATSASPLAEPEASSSRAPTAPSAMAAARPSAPEAPVVTTTWPDRSNRDSGLRRASGVTSARPRRDAEPLFRVDDRHDPDRAAVAQREAPREGQERASLPGHRVQFAAVVLDARDAGGQHDLVRGVPIREVVADLTAGLGAVLLKQVRHDRARPVLGHPGAERVVQRLHVDPDQLDAL